jgi:hypothetical protein
VLRSDVILPLPPEVDDDGDGSLLEVTRGELGPSTLGRHGWRARDGGVDLDLPAVGWTRLEGSRATVHTEETPDSELLGQAIATTLLTAWAIVRSTAVVLHGAYVEYGGRGVAICAASGVGKSTLAAACAAQGGRVLGDDACHLTATGVTQVATRGTTSVRLAPDAARALGFDPCSMPAAVGDRREKVVLDLTEDHGGSVSTLDGVAFLRRAPGTAVATAQPVRGAHALPRLVDAVYRPRLTRHAQGEQRPFEVAAELAATVPMVELVVPDRLERLPHAADVLLDWVSSLP